MGIILKTFVILPEIHIIFILQKTHLPSMNNTYLLWGGGNPTMGGKCYYIVRFPPGEKLLYSQFSGGKGYYTTPVVPFSL